MRVWVLFCDFDTMGVFLSKEDAEDWVKRHHPEAIFDDDNYWNGYSIEDWDVTN